VSLEYWSSSLALNPIGKDVPSLLIAYTSSISSQAYTIDNLSNQ